MPSTEHTCLQRANFGAIRCGVADVATIAFGDFEWDSGKAMENVRKHGVSFDEATEVFDDPRALDAPDLYLPERFVIIGRSSRDRILLVVSRDEGSMTRYDWSRARRGYWVGRLRRGNQRTLDADVAAPSRTTSR